MLSVAVIMFREVLEGSADRQHRVGGDTRRRVSRALDFGRYCGWCRWGLFDRLVRGHDRGALRQDTARKN